MIEPFNYYNIKNRDVNGYPITAPYMDTCRGTPYPKWKDWDISKANLSADTVMYMEQRSAFQDIRPATGKLIRLAFHDCVKNIDPVTNKKIGGCDGCLNWKGVGFRFKSSANDEIPFSYDTPKHQDNNGLEYTVKALELVYTNPAWPSNAPSLPTSLKKSGKSRADLWQFAANVALELEIERSNFACDLHIRENQVNVLEGKDACKLKLHKPITFQYGRADCIPDESKRLTNLSYEATNEESEFNAYGKANVILETMSEDFGFTAEQTISLMAAHSVADGKNARQDTAYVWFGGKFLTNTYYKYLAQTPLYQPITLSPGAQNQEVVTPFAFVLEGDEDGEPMDGMRWQLHCHPYWNSTIHPDGGPCHFRPTSTFCAHNRMRPDRAPCFVGFNSTGQIVVSSNSNF